MDGSKETRKRVIPTRTIGMEHLIDIILIDEPKEQPVIPILNVNNIKKFPYKETSV